MVEQAGVPGGAGRMSTRGLADGVESVCRVADCGHPELLTALAVLLVTVVALLLAGAALVGLRDAREAVAVEHRRATAERDAFEQFRRRVSRLETNTPATPDVGPPTGGGAVATASRGVDEDGLVAVRRAYDETVMSTPHHASEYDETLGQSMAAEFTEGIAGTVVGGGHLTPALQTALVRSAEEAERRRTELLSKLDTEETALDRARETLAPAADAVDAVREDATDGGFVDLVAATERIEWHESNVERLLADRQETIQSHEREYPHWFDYLYGDLDVAHPVLSTATGVLADLDDARDTVAAAAARR
ncbi:hypothetical protein RYH80_08655 [Halobaculum sp. MBLA0147]|uniref:DUF7260 family protein n=1 Tax=Halobaculum sp. MBLA0147 TaxID=3079934 RepID=UPI003524D174